MIGHQPIAYLSLRMDKGEGMRYAAESIARVSTQKPVGCFYDIVCTQGQLETATVFARDITTLITEMNPGISDKLKMIAITTDNENRPAALHMLHITGVNVEVKDINPGREKDWHG